MLQGDFGPSLRFRKYSVGDIISADLLYSLTIGFWAVVAAGPLKRSTATDYLAGTAGVAGIAVPVFMIGPLAQVIFALHLRWVPVGGADQGWRGLILPVIACLGPATAGIITGSILIATIFAVPGIGWHFVDAALNRDYPLVMGITLLYGALLILFNIGTDLVRGWLDPKERSHGCRFGTQVTLDLSVATEALCRQPLIRGHVMIVHGLADSNVGPENTHAAVRELTAVGIPHEVMLFSNEGHGVFRRTNVETYLIRSAAFLERAFAEGMR